MSISLACLYQKQRIIPAAELLIQGRFITNFRKGTTTFEGEITPG